MAAPLEPADEAPIPLRRPPIRQSTLVRSGVEHTFAVFVREIGTWWPTPTFSAGRNRVRTVTVEHRGWEALTAAQLAEDCALPGGYTSGAYVTGWTRILAALTRAAEADTEEPR